jgi:putative hydrolase of HD superfamily
LTNGHTWKEGHPSVEQVYKRIGIVKEVIPDLWPWVEKNIQNAVEKGWLKG